MTLHDERFYAVLIAGKAQGAVLELAL